MVKCSCYFQHGLKFLCYGTKDIVECDCGGDERKCDFCTEKRKKKAVPRKRYDLVEREAIKDAIGFMNLHFLGHGETKSVLDSINEVPAVDAVEVVHGMWSEWWPPAHTIMTGEEMLYRCSVCDAKYADVEGFRYCPYCGANME